jgi:hypothetical protein
MGARRDKRREEKRLRKEEGLEVNPLITTGAKILSFIVPKMFKDSKGKWSSRRTIGGVIAIAAVHQIDVQGEVTWQLLTMLGLAVATLYAAK